MSEPVGVLLVAAGAGLVYAAITNQNPLTEARKALSTGSTDGRPEPDADGFGFFARLRARVAAGVTDAAEQAQQNAGSSAPTPAIAGNGSWPDDPSNLVAIGQGGLKLAEPAAQAFAAWQAAYGQRIPVTDAYRTSSQQNAAGGPNGNNRFASATGSAHVEGRAVDVNLRALGIVVGANPSTWMQNPAFAKLAQTASAAGWCNYQLQRGSTNGKIPEPWHFSYEVCK